MVGEPKHVSDIITEFHLERKSEYRLYIHNNSANKYVFLQNILEPLNSHSTRMCNKTEIFI